MIRTMTALAAALALGLSGAAVAQGSAGFPGETLDAFAEAAVTLQQIREEATATIAAAPTPEAEQAAVTEANARMASAVTETPGISIEEYNGIVAAAQADPELAERLATLIAEVAE